MEKLKTIIRELTDLQGNVGYEDAVIHSVADHLEKFGKVTIDHLGNLICHLTPKNVGKKKVMLFGHTDEVGMMVKAISDDGFVFCEKLGSLNPTCLAGQRVQLDGEFGKVNGIIGVKSHHLLTETDRKGQKTVQEQYIDIGAVSKKAVLEAGVRVGTPVSFKPEFMELQNNCISNKSMDDRAAVGILIYLAECLDVKACKADIYLVFSVQEEFNTRGIMPAVRTIDPDIVLGIDVTPATDTPDLKGMSEIALGKGPAITYMNHHSRGTLAGIVPNKRFLSHLEEIAKDAGISLNREVACGILTETAYIAIENSRVVVANLSLPTRYTHSPVEIINLEDALGIVTILERFLMGVNEKTRFGKDVDFERREKS